MALTNCCTASFIDETDLCSDCLEHADEMEEEDLDCCESSAYGFKCTCVKTSWASRYDQDEDSAYEAYRDGLAEDERLNNE